MTSVDVYLFQVRTTPTEKWHFTKSPMTADEARSLYGAGNFRVLLSTKQVRKGVENAGAAVESAEAAPASVESQVADCVVLDAAAHSAAPSESMESTVMLGTSPS